MKFNINEIDLLEAKKIELLYDLGIQDSAQLFNSINVPKKRELISKKTGIEIDKLEMVARILDLSRIQGITYPSAKFLVQNDLITCVQDILRFSTKYEEYINKDEVTYSRFILNKVKKTIKNIFIHHGNNNIGENAAAVDFHLELDEEKIGNFLDQIKKIVQAGEDKKILVLKKRDFLISVINSAFELKNRLFIRDNKNQELDNILFIENRKKRKKFMRFFDMKLFYFLFFVCALLCVSIILSELLEIFIDTGQYDYSGLIVEYRYSFINNFINYGIMFSFSFFIIITLAPQIGVNILFLIMNWVRDHILKKLILPSIEDRVLYYRFENNSIEFRKKLISPVLTAAIATALCLGAIYCNQHLGPDLIDLLYYLELILVFLVILPDFIYQVFVSKFNYEKEKNRIKRILIFATSDLFLKISALLLIIVFLLPVLFNGLVRFNDYLVEKTTQKIEQECAVLNETLVGEKREEFEEYIYLNGFSNNSSESIAVGCFDGDVFNGFQKINHVSSALDFALSNINWVYDYLIIPIFSFVVLIEILWPFLFVGGIWKGLLFFAIVLVTEKASGLLNSMVLEGLQFTETSIFKGIFLLVSLFFVSAIFDWIYSEIITREIVCPVCANESEYGDNYCSVCGYEFNSQLENGE